MYKVLKDMRAICTHIFFWECGAVCSQNSAILFHLLWIRDK